MEQLDPQEELWALEMGFCMSNLPLKQRLSCLRLFKDFQGIKSCYDYLAEKQGLRQNYKSFKRIYMKCAELDIAMLSCFHKEYPACLLKLSDPPPILYYRGQFQLKEKRCAIVGSRKGDLRVCNFIRQLARQLAESGVQIISGFAVGVDTFAHRGALDSGVEGATIAVLGNGLPEIYPRSNQRLSETLIENSSFFLSQFHPFTPAYPANFLNRNRIIAGLANTVVLAQGAVRSGSLVTVRQAIEQGKDIWVIPGSVNDSRYLGSNKLIQAGALTITRIEDYRLILEES